MAVYPWDENRVWQLMALKLAGEANQDALTELGELCARYPEIEYYTSIVSHWWNLTQQMGKEDADLFVKKLMTEIEFENKAAANDRSKKCKWRIG